MGEVIDLDVQTTLDVPAEKVLRKAMEANLDEVIIIGHGPNGIHHASSSSSIPELLFRMEMFKQELLDSAKG